MAELSNLEIDVLNEALDDEYKAWATYPQVIADFGDIRPFSSIREAEGRHMQALLTLYKRYGLAVSPNPWSGKVKRYASFQAACEAGVAAEIANAELYERLLKATEKPDILLVLRRLQEALQQRHLPAFQRCAQGRAGRCGRRMGRGGGGKRP